MCIPEQVHHPVQLFLKQHVVFTDPLVKFVPAFLLVLVSVAYAHVLSSPASKTQSECPQTGLLGSLATGAEEISSPEIWQSISIYRDAAHSEPTYSRASIHVYDDSRSVRPIPPLICTGVVHTSMRQMIIIYVHQP